jgi:hypothetical protein
VGQAGETDSVALGGKALADETEKEAIAIWYSRNADLALLGKCIVLVASKESQKQRADYEPFEQSSLFPDERFFNFEFDRTLVDDELAMDERLAALRTAGEEFLNGQRTLSRQCVWTMTRKESAYTLHDNVEMLY